MLIVGVADVVIGKVAVVVGPVVVIVDFMIVVGVTAVFVDLVEGYRESVVVLGGDVFAFVVSGMVIV